MRLTLSLTLLLASFVSAQQPQRGAPPRALPAASLQVAVAVAAAVYRR